MVHKSIDTGLEVDDLESIIEMFSKNQSIKEAILFGSRAIGTYKTGSDIDIALKGSALTLDDILNLSIKYDELDLPYKLDLLIFEHINEAKLKEHINRAGIKIYSSNSKSHL